jgi:hypothetical protein
MLFTDNIQRHIYTGCTLGVQLLCQPLPLLPITPFPFALANPSFYLLGEPASLACGANTHPLLSLVWYQLFSPCCFTHPKAPHRSSYIRIYIDNINNISRLI